MLRRLPAIGDAPGVAATAGYSDALPPCDDSARLVPVSRGALAVSLRLAAFVAALLAGSGFGSLFTWRSTSSWEDANPLTASVVGLLSLGSAALLAAFAPIGARGAGLVCVVLGTAMVVMWWLFAANESSTSSLVFLWGWLAGIPAAATLGVLASRRASGAFR